MKNITTILASAMVVGFIGCGSTGELPEGEAQNDGSLYQNVVPTPMEGVGPEVNFEDYLFYNNERINKETHRYEKDASGNLYYTNMLSVFTKSLGNQLEPIITQTTVDNTIISEDTVDTIRITSFKYSENTALPSISYYPLKIQKNEEAITNIADTTCVLLEFEGGSQNLENKLPTDILNDLNSKDSNLNLNYLDVMHVYCGSTDNSTVDIYYASGYGKVLSILDSLDKKVYEITSKNGFYK